MAPVRDIPKNIEQLDRQIRLGKPLAKATPKKGTKASPGSDSGYETARGQVVAQANPGIVGGARFASSAMKAMPKRTLPERAHEIVKKMSPEARGQYLALVLGKVYKREAPKLGFSKEGE